MKQLSFLAHWGWIQGLWLIALTACQPPAYHSSDPTVFRCETDGFCVRTEGLGLHSLIGGVRHGQDELKFEMLHRPTGNPELPAWCQRVQDGLGQRMYIFAGPACPSDWSGGSWDGNLPPSGAQSRQERRKLLRTMLTNLKKGRAPQGREEAWNQLTIIAEELVTGRVVDLIEQRCERRRDGALSGFSRHSPAAEPLAPGHASEGRRIDTSSKKDSKVCDLLRRVNGGFHPG